MGMKMKPFVRTFEIFQSFNIFLGSTRYSASNIPMYSLFGSLKPNLP